MTRKLIGQYGLLLAEQHLQYYSPNTMEQQLAVCGLERVDSLAVNWTEAGSLLVRLIYQLVYAQARLVHAVTRGRSCSNVGLSVIARAKRAGTKKRRR